MRGREDYVENLRIRYLKKRYILQDIEVSFKSKYVYDQLRSSVKENIKLKIKNQKTKYRF